MDSYNSYPEIITVLAFASCPYTYRTAADHTLDR